MSSFPILSAPVHSRSIPALLQNQYDEYEAAPEEDSYAAPAAAAAAAAAVAVPVAAASAAGSRGASAVETWSVTMLDAKKKKKKGTLGVGNGSLFFASESDKVRSRPSSTSLTEP